MNVLAVLRDLVRDFHQLRCDDPTNPARYGNRNQDGGENRRYPAGAQLLEKRHRRC
jgi:hypothetical protein